MKNEKEYVKIGVFFAVLAFAGFVFGFGFCRQAQLPLGICRLVSLVLGGIPTIVSLYFIYGKCDSWMK